VNPEFLIPTIIAAYGAILSTILAIHELVKGRPRVKVSASHGYLYNGMGMPSEPVIMIEAVNVGAGTIHLNGCGWLNRDGTRQHITIPYPPGALPMHLNERKKCTTVYAGRWFRDKADHKKIVGVYFQDETGKNRTGKIKRRDKEMWLSSKGEGWSIG
jgi:hypothetical protein